MKWNTIVLTGTSLLMASLLSGCFTGLGGFGGLGNIPSWGKADPAPFAVEYATTQESERPSATNLAERRELPIPGENNG